ncbi:DUF1054 domain-containing protein [Bacillus sp. CGMCC 1.16541]|uniref:YktB family protein n=1 Tax=Bacillus sp. CGMCC 1.16541 TaxID=2185143 RepID=UPI000D738CA8|nr:DUF1054 domain-containing protein [Bacillus sp. CGMCC 1.16541]
MTFSGFQEEDFNVFQIEGLDARMEAIKAQIRPKFETLGYHFAPTLSALCGDEMHVHIAKHARRTVNPPKDTWVAFANSKRGYKKLPHFQIGLWESHVFIWFAVIYESPIKEGFGQVLQKEIKKVQELIPSHFVWSTDHTKPDTLTTENLQTDGLFQLFNRLQTIKKAEILCGITIPQAQAVSMTSEDWLKTIDKTFRTLQPLYEMAKQQ